MDNITKSLKDYLRMQEIEHTTLFNDDCGLKKSTPTSTCYVCRLENKSKWRISLVFDIYPADNLISIAAHPQFIISKKMMDKMRPFETKWNVSGFLTTLVLEKEMGVVMPNVYCLKLSILIYCGKMGLDAFVWNKYIEKIKDELSYIAEYFHKTNR